MRLRLPVLLCLGIAVIVTVAIVALRRDEQPTNAAARQTLPPTLRADPGLRPLFRPFAHAIDPRFRGRLVMPTAVRGTLLGTGLADAAAVAILERSWQQTVAAEPADVGAFVDLHRRLLWLGWWNRAEAAADALLAVVPAHPPALALLAAVRFEQGRRGEGLALAQRALASSPDLVQGLVAEAAALAPTAAFDDAVARLERAARLEPDAPEPAFLLGTLLCGRSDFAAGMPWLQRAREHLPDPAVGKGPFIVMMTALAQLLQGRPAHRVPKDFHGVELPLQRVPLWAVPVRMEGQGSSVEGLMVVDSGASMTVVAPSVARVARQAAAAPAALGVAGAMHTVPAVVDRLVLGELQFADVPVLIDQSQQEPVGAGVIGHIGVSLLRGFLVTLDLRHDRLRLDPPGTVAAPSAIDVPFELLHNVPLVRARLGRGAERQFLFDTGASALFVSAAVAQADLGLAATEPRARPSAMVAIGGQEVATVAVPSSIPLWLGGVALPLKEAVIDPSLASRNAAGRTEWAGTIGLFVRARFTLDFGRQRLGIEP